MRPWYKIYLLDVVEALPLYLFYGLCWLLPIDAASALGGWLGGWLGPRLPAHRLAAKHLQRAFPEKDTHWHHATLLAMWRHQGRVLAEYPHLRRILQQGRVEIIGAEFIAALRDDNAAGFFFTGHIGNWELCPGVIAAQRLEMHSVFRRPNNRWSDWLLQRARGNPALLIPKGSSGARQILKILKKSGHVGMLLDQKNNDGIAVNFFARPAMTAPAMGHFAYKFSCPMVGVWCQRQQGAHFRITAEAPWQIDHSLPQDEAIKQLLQRVNDWYEDKIRQHPEQWLWQHRRWVDDAR